MKKSGWFPSFLFPWRRFPVDKALREQARQLVGDAIEDEGDRYRALIASGMEPIASAIVGAAGWTAPAPAISGLTVPLIRLRIQRFCDALQWHIEGWDFEGAKKQGWFSEHGSGVPPWWDEARRHKQEFFSNLLVFVDRKAQTTLDPMQFAVSRDARLYLGSHAFASALCAESPEMLAMLRWRYGDTDDVAMAIANSIRPGLNEVLSQHSPSAACLQVLRPERSQYRLQASNPTSPVSIWLQGEQARGPEIQWSDRGEGIFCVIVQDEARDEFFLRYRAAELSSGVRLSVDF